MTANRHALPPSLRGLCSWARSRLHRLTDTRRAGVISKSHRSCIPVATEHAGKVIQIDPGAWRSVARQASRRILVTDDPVHHLTSSDPWLRKPVRLSSAKGKRACSTAVLANVRPRRWPYSRGYRRADLTPRSCIPGARMAI